MGLKTIEWVAFFYNEGATIKEQTAWRQPCPIWHDARRQLQISAEKVNLASSEVSEGPEVNESEEDADTADPHPENIDVEVAEYDSSTDEEEEVDGGGSHIPELDRRSTFLMGTTTRFGRQIRINNRFLR